MDLDDETRAGYAGLVKQGLGGKSVINESTSHSVVADIRIVPDYLGWLDVVFTGTLVTPRKVRLDSDSWRVILTYDFEIHCGVMQGGSYHPFLFPQSPTTQSRLTVKLHDEQGNLLMEESAAYPPPIENFLFCLSLVGYDYDAILYQAGAMILSSQGQPEVKRLHDAYLAALAETLEARLARHNSAE